MADRFYDLEVAGLKRRLPILPLPDAKGAVAAFIILGDIELTDACARELARKIPPDTELLMTAETKGIPLIEAMARELGMTHYVVARKSKKLYMKNTISVEDESITTEKKQRLYLADDDIARLQGCRVCLIDDVISRGGSMRAMRELATKAGARIVGEAAIIAEGEAARRSDILFLATLPLFAAT